MASVLRINRPFMEYMRKNFGKIARQKHGVTLINEEEAARLVGRVVAWLDGVWSRVAAVRARLRVLPPSLERRRKEV